MLESGLKFNVAFNLWVYTHPVIVFSQDPVAIKGLIVLGRISREAAIVVSGDCSDLIVIAGFVVNAHLADMGEWPSSLDRRLLSANDRVGGRIEMRSAVGCRPNAVILPKTIASVEI